MWTEITRPKYDRVAPRYASDPDRCGMGADRAFYAGAQTVGPPAGTDLRARCWTPSCISPEPAASGACCQRTFHAVHHGARVFLSLARQRFVRADQFLRLLLQRAGLPAANRARRPGSSTANRVKTTRERRAPGLRCRQEDQGPQASCRDRYLRPACWSVSWSIPPTSRTATVPGSSSKPSTICFPGCATSLPTVSTTLVPTCVRRWSNSAIGRSRSSNAPRRPPDFSCCRGAAGGRTHLGLVEPQPPPRQRLQGVDRQRRRLGLYCLNATLRPAISTNTTSAILSQTLRLAVKRFQTR